MGHMHAIAPRTPHPQTLLNACPPPTAPSPCSSTCTTPWHYTSLTFTSFFFLGIGAGVGAGAGGVGVGAGGVGGVGGGVGGVGGGVGGVGGVGGDLPPDCAIAVALACRRGGWGQEQGWAGAWGVWQGVQGGRRSSSQCNTRPISTACRNAVAHLGRACPRGGSKCVRRGSGGVHIGVGKSIRQCDGVWDGKWHGGVGCLFDWWSWVLPE